MSKMIFFLSLGMLLVLVCGCGEEPKKNETPEAPATASNTDLNSSDCKDGVCKLKDEAVAKPEVECKDGVCKLKDEAVAKPEVECKDGVCKLKEECKNADKCVCDDKTNPKCKSAPVKAPDVKDSETK